MHRFTLIGSVLLLLNSTAFLSAQGLCWVTRSAAAQSSEIQGLYDGLDVGFADATLKTERWFDQRNFDVALGDRDGNGRFDDAPSRIDAISSADAFGGDDVVGLLMSFSANFNDLAGNAILDGDVVRLLGNGQVDVVFSESNFSQWTGTGNVDVDAFHIDADGSILFSFAEDEPSSDAVLIAQNGGTSTFDESTVFRVGTNGVAEILFTKDDVIALANLAFGTSVTSVVDTTGLCADPSNAGHWLLTFGSANNAIEGKVLSSASGGLPFLINGQAVDSPGLGFNDLEILAGLSWIETAPELLTVHHPEELGFDGATATFRISDAQPLTTVRLVTAISRFPAESATTLPGIPGRNHLLLDVGTGLYQPSLIDAAFLTTTDSMGNADLSFDVAGLPPGLSLTLQAINLATLAVSSAITLSL